VFCVSLSTCWLVSACICFIGLCVQLSKSDCKLDQFIIIGGIIVDFLRMRCVLVALCGIVLLTQVIITDSQESGKCRSFLYVC